MGSSTFRSNKSLECESPPKHPRGFPVRNGPICVAERLPSPKTTDVYLGRSSQPQCQPNEPPLVVGPSIRGSSETRLSAVLSRWFGSYGKGIITAHMRPNPRQKNAQARRNNAPTTRMMFDHDAN